MQILSFKKISILIFLFSFASLTHAEPTEFPPTLSSVNGTSSSGATSTSTPIENTPEYVIIKPSDQITFSSETAASVAEINVKEGSAFHIGDVLLKLDCRLQEAELQKALAQQSSADMAGKAATKLQSFGSISKYELVKATSDARAADADVKKLRAIVDKCVIKAPFNGSVSELMVHPYETVKQGDPLLQIINTENLEFEMQVPSCWLSWLHTGSMFDVHINEINKNISAKVSRIDPQIDPVSQTVKLIAIIYPPDKNLIAGMSGQAIFSPDIPKNCSVGKGNYGN